MPKNFIAIEKNQTVTSVLEYIKKNSESNYHYVSNGQYERLMYTAELIENSFKKTDSILDIGSHPYFLPAYLSLRGFEKITTCEIPRSDDFKQCPTWNFNSISLDIEEAELPLEDNSLDAVFLLEVYEHLYRRPNQVFRELRRVLKPGGKLLISTPNGGALPKYIQVLIKKQFGSKMYDWSEVYEKLGHFTHIREYSLKEISDYIGNFNFSIKKASHLSFHQLDSPYQGKIRSLMYSIYRLLRRILFFVPVIQNNILIVAINNK